MKYHLSKKTLFCKVLLLGGFHSYLFHLGLLHPLVIFTSLLLLVALFFKFKYKKNHMLLLFPLSSGLLCFLMRLFYWDQVDFTRRVSLLLTISLFFSLVLAVRKFRLFKKFLFFFLRLPLRRQLTAIFIFAEILYLGAAVVMIRKGVVLGGDEPHYLVISHSIARDFDLNVFNQYARDEYRDIIDLPLSHHARVGKGFKVWYSYGHLPGLSLTLAPFFLVKIPPPLLYFLIRIFLGLFGALLAVLVYLSALKLWRNASLAVFITLVFSLTAPVFFYSLHIFAEVQASLLILASLYLLVLSPAKTDRLPPPAKRTKKQPGSPGKQKRSGVYKRTLLAGLLLGISVFWGLKYAIFIYLFGAGFFIYFVIKKQPRRALLFIVFPALMQLLFFGYLYHAYGNFNPMSIYNGVMTAEQVKEYHANIQKIPLQKRIETLLGIFLDQRDGLLLYNPFYFLAFPGLFLALKRFKKYWPHLLVSGAGIGFILFLGYSTVRPGYCPQARYLAPVAWLLMLWAVIFYREVNGKFLKKLFFSLPVAAMLIVLYQVFHPFTLYQSATHANLYRQGLMFQQWSNIYFDIPAILPSFVKIPGNFQYLPNLVFLALIAILILLSLTKISPGFFPKGFLPNVRGGRDAALPPSKAFRFMSFFLPGAKGKEPSNHLMSSPSRQRPERVTGLWILFGLLFLIFVLFPRVPLYNPIFVTKAGDIPYKVYGRSNYPTHAQSKKFELKGKSSFDFTVSTLEPVPCFELELENGGVQEFRVGISSFDRPVKRVNVPVGSIRRVPVKNPRFKRFQGRRYYRFHLKAEPAAPDPPSLFVQLYPVK